jgi:hypothetical protein
VLTLKRRYDMKKYVTIGLVLIFLFGFLIPPAYCQESYKKTSTRKSTTSGEKMIIDFLVARPLGIFSCVVGFAAAIVTIPFVAISQDTSGRVFDEFLTKPGDFTFTRPLGEGI